jgi:hypothetical protein
MLSLQTKFPPPRQVPVKDLTPTDFASMVSIPTELSDRGAAD